MTSRLTLKDRGCDPDTLLPRNALQTVSERLQDIIIIPNRMGMYLQ